VPPVFLSATDNTCIILGLVPRIQHAASAGASGKVDGRDKPDHDNVGINGQSLNTCVVDDGPWVAQLPAVAAPTTDERANWMPRFIKLKDEDGAEVAVNVDMITKIVPGTDDELTEVYLLDEEDALEVEDSLEEILAKVKVAS